MFIIKTFSHVSFDMKKYHDQIFFKVIQKKVSHIRFHIKICLSEKKSDVKFDKQNWLEICDLVKD